MLPDAGLQPGWDTRLLLVVHWHHSSALVGRGRGHPLQVCGTCGIAAVAARAWSVSLSGDVAGGQLVAIGRLPVPSPAILEKVSLRFQTVKTIRAGSDERRPCPGVPADSPK